MEPRRSYVTIKHKMSQQTTPHDLEDIQAEHQGLPEIPADLVTENDVLSELGYSLTVEGVAERLGVSTKAARALVRTGLAGLKSTDPVA